MLNIAPKVCMYSLAISSTIADVRLFSVICFDAAQEGKVCAQRRATLSSSRRSSCIGLK